MKKFLKNSEGFTLVELMVVVAIIGILSAIAVPNFKKYQAKSKQSEAKLQMAALYTTEVAANADYDTYATCLTSLGYDTPPRGFYIVGFSATEATTMNAINARQPAACNNIGFAIAPLAPNHLKVDAAALPAAADLTSIAPTSTTFTASAVGDISAAAIPLDIWTIDQGKQTINTAIGY